MQEGVVKWFDNDKGFGFIEQDVGEDLFVHYSEVAQDGYKTLEDGDKVEFEIEETDKGLAAKEVIRSTDSTGNGQSEQTTDVNSFDTETLENQMTGA